MFSIERKTGALRFQSHVYAAVREWILEKNLKSVLDVGCGCPEKLRLYVFPVSSDVTGVDMLSEDDFSEYDMTYHKVDLEDSLIELNRTFDIIVCADVIEHIAKTSKLLDLTKRHANQDTYVVFSTPDIDSVDATKIKVHEEHVHSWNRDAFKLFLDCHGFNVVSSNLVKEFVGNNVSYNSHICLCKLK